MPQTQDQLAALTEAYNKVKSGNHTFNADQVDAINQLANRWGVAKEEPSSEIKSPEIKSKNIFGQEVTTPSGFKGGSDINIDTKSSLINAASMGGGALVGALTKSPLASGATMAAINQLLQTKYGDKSEIPSGAGDAAFKMGAETLGNVISGKVVEGAVNTPEMLSNVLKEYRTPGSVVDKTLAQLEATYSQYKGSAVGKFIENTFTPFLKNKAFQNSQNLSQDLINEQLTNLAQNPVTMEDYSRLAGIAKNTLSSNYYNGVKASVAKGNIVQGLAENIPIPIYKQAPLPPGIAPSGPSMILDHTVKGPVEMSSAIAKAKDVVDEITKSPTNDILTNIIADPKYNKLQKTSANILLNTSAKFDQNNNLISHDPISFKNAWQWQKDLGNYTANAFDSGRANFNKTQLWDLYNSLGDDISTSLPKWQLQGQSVGQQALKLFNDSKAIAKEYLGTFFPQDAPLQLGKIVLGNEANVAKDWHKIIDDNHLLQRTLNAGELPLAQQAGANISNPRQELATFKLADLWRNARVTDNTGNIKFDMKKFLNDFNDPSFAQSESSNISSSKDLLFSKGTQDDIRRIATAIGKIESGAIQPSRYLILREASGLFGLGAGLGTAMLTGSLPAGSGIAGVILGTRGISKWMTSKNAARLLVAMTEGQPLGMPERFAAQIIGKALRNEAVQILYDNGDRTDAKINNEGKVTIPLGERVLRSSVGK